MCKGLWSPDRLTYYTLIYFSGAIQRGKVYKTKRHMFKKLKTEIGTQIAQIGCALLRKVSTNVVRRVRMCNGAEGWHFEHLVWLRKTNLFRRFFYLYSAQILYKVHYGYRCI
jgi:hypothetical protein